MAPRFDPSDLNGLATVRAIQHEEVEQLVHQQSLDPAALLAHMPA